METTVDRFGRIVIPKRLREDLGLRPGTRLEIEAAGEELLLKPVHEEPYVGDREGVLVFTGSAGENLLEAVKRHRRERTGKMTRR
jgi:AbrB family looped-hinge helix DNA binding protein